MSATEVVYLYSRSNKARHVASEGPPFSAGRWNRSLCGYPYDTDQTMAMLAGQYEDAEERIALKRSLPVCKACARVLERQAARS